MQQSGPTRTCLTVPTYLPSNEELLALRSAALELTQELERDAPELRALLGQIDAELRWRKMEFKLNPDGTLMPVGPSAPRLVT